MNLLHSNDRLGQYPASWYADTADPLPQFPRLKGDTSADIAVIGGGFTGLSTALHAAQKGYDVVLIEAHRVGFGASGRNGGQVSGGQRQDQDVLERAHGRDDARKLWDISLQSVALVRSLIAAYGMNALWRDGVAHADRTEKGAAETRAYAGRLARDYGYDKAEPLDRAGIRALIGSDAFHGGSVDWGSGHIHPLRFALVVLATAAILVHTLPPPALEPLEPFEPFEPFEPLPDPDDEPPAASARVAAATTPATASTHPQASREASRRALLEALARDFGLR